MAYEEAKTVLQDAVTEDQRLEAIESALRLGMPLHEIETYLDWLDFLRRSLDDPPSK